MNRADLLALAKPKVNEIEVEGIGKLTVRAFPAIAGWQLAQKIKAAGDDQAQVVELLVDCMVTCLVNDDGSAMFTQGERDSVVGELGFDFVMKVGSEIMKTFNAVTVETQEKN